jgi:hypothetical protein
MKFFLLSLLLSVSSFLEGSISLNSATTVIFKGVPGQVITSPISISNTSDKPEEVTIYCKDYLFFSDGSCRFDPISSHPKSIGSWIKLSQNHLTLAPKLKGETHFSVMIPNDPSLEGTYWGIIFVEPVTAPVIRPSETKLFQTVKSNVRYGIQVVVEIQKTGNYAVKVLKQDLSFEKETPFIHFDVENQGSRFVQLKSTLDLFTKEGKKIKEISVPKRLLYPTCSSRLNFDLKGVDPGDYIGFLVLDHSEEAIFGGKYPFTISPLKPKELEKKES